MKKYYQLWAIGLAVLITSCTTLPPQPSLSWQNQQKILSKRTQWSLTGKIAVRTAKESGSATLQWQQDNAQYIVQLYNPLGTSSVKLVGKPGKVVLEDASGSRATSTNPSQLLLEQTGWQLPIENLYYWIRSLPVPNHAYKASRDVQHRLLSLSQQGWYIQYLEYTTPQAGFSLPRKIVLESQGIQVKMVIYEWEFH